ncbi:unnamed protein product (macronuclear) [Paramecium tetraurelia]|uniref:Uncharacterized protein n=1 Tax=Paramecium tetraurelia TaxID=5888 RepID=A0DBR5_PARTE|nr:uncharacterized protein GSPATT00015379001 [Paramecium tetraurelia]CAK80482.1 unnamed protein product [Paramecium tetraurelia]|eukprot:XP_001447879.1 hypothetical protein (macronuclear) [Paramecium tetraurelia strain d4-2]
MPPNKFHHKASTDIDTINKTTSIATNPYYNQYLKRASNSSHQDKPPSLQYSNSKSNLNPNQSHDYSIQFKVGSKNDKKNDSINETQLSQFVNPTKQFVCMSPAQNRDNSIIFQSPKQIQQPTVVQSPQPYNLINTPIYYNNNKGSQSQLKSINYNNPNLFNELKQLQDSNNLLQQTIQQRESEVQRGQSSQFIQELEQKINLLQQLNEKLQLENQSLIEQTDVTRMKENLEKSLQNRKQTSQQLQSIKSEQQQYQLKCDELQNKLDQYDDSQIKDLVNELENKVQNLIAENDRLNQQLSSNSHLQMISDIARLKNENDNLNKQQQQLKRDEEHLKLTYNQVEQVYEQKMADNLYADLYEKIQLLIEENDRLQQVITDSEYTDQDLQDIKARIKVVKQDNIKMEQQLKRKNLNKNY